MRDAGGLAVELSPSDPESHYALAGLLTASGDYAGAARAYEQTLRLRPSDYVVWLELGKAREQAGDVEGALAAFRESARLAPFYAQPRWQLGNTLLRAGRLDEALAEMRAAAESDPKLYRTFLQAVWHVSGKDAGAVMEVARPRDPEESLALARFLARSGEPAAAVKVYREAASRLPEGARRTVVAELIKAGGFAEAHEVWGGGGRPGQLTDGGFEATHRTDEGGFGWRFADKVETVRASLDTQGPREGARSLRLEMAGNFEPSSRLLSQLVLVEPGARYRLEFSARTRNLVTGGPVLVGVSLAEGEHEGRRLASAEPLPTGTTEGWRDFSLEFAAPEGARAVLVFVRRQECTARPCPAFGSLWLDRFGMKKL